MVRAFCRPHAYTFNEQSKMATALTPRHFRESHVTDGEPKTAVSASLQKMKSIQNQHKHFVSFFYFIKSQICDSFVNHFDGHFSYLKTLDFSFKCFELLNHCKQTIFISKRRHRGIFLPQQSCALLIPWWGGHASLYLLCYMLSRMEAGRKDKQI